jgi:hypothetical protein
MTLEQLYSLTELELETVLHIVNNLFPIEGMKTLSPIGLTWFRAGELEKKLIKSFNYIKSDGHCVLSSVLTKLKIDHKIEKFDTSSENLLRIATF